MSSTPSPVTAEHFRYLAERTAQEDDFLRALKRAAEAEGIPPIWIAPEQASFLQILLKLQGAKTVLDIGTLAGVSAIVLARALPPGGHVHTFEINPKHADFAERWIEKSDVAGRIIVYRGAAQEILPEFSADSADAALLDADKAGYPLYLKECLRILRPRGLVLADNAFAFGELFAERPTDPEVGAIRTFNDLIARTKELHGIIIPIGDGCWVGVKNDPSSP